MRKVGISASESKNVRSISKAVKQVFFKICLFYLVGLFLTSLLVPYNHPNLIGNSGSSDSDISSSPFVLALAVAKIDLLPDFMNIVILVSILSVSNSAIYASSRTLLTLSQNGQAPSFINYLDKKKRPIVANLIVLSFGSLSYSSIIFKQGSEIVFYWLMSLSGFSVLFTYASICLSHIRFRKMLKLKNIDYKKELRYKSQIGVFGSWYGIVFSIFILIAQIYTAINPNGSGSFNLTNFFQKMLGIFFVLILFFASKLYLYIKYNDTGFLVDLHEVNMKQGVFRTEQSRQLNRREIRNEREIEKNKPWYIRLYNIWC